MVALNRKREKNSSVGLIDRWVAECREVKNDRS